VLAGDGAAELDRGRHHLAERRPRSTLGVRVVGRVDDQRVGVAVAGVGDGRDLHVVLRRDRDDPREQVR
jgi:hypothetical protein